MAGKKAPGNADLTMVATSRDQLPRIANLLALIAVRGEAQEQKIVTLDAVGFSRNEIASLLGTTPQTITVTLYASRKRTRRKKKRTTKKGSGA